MSEPDRINRALADVRKQVPDIPTGIARVLADEVERLRASEIVRQPASEPASELYDPGTHEEIRSRFQAAADAEGIPPCFHSKMNWKCVGCLWGQLERSEYVIADYRAALAAARGDTPERTYREALEKIQAASTVRNARELASWALTDDRGETP